MQDDVGAATDVEQDGVVAVAAAVAVEVVVNDDGGVMNDSETA